jgi:hypothetical protein
LGEFLATLIQKITAVAMKKYLFIILGLIGAGMIGYSVMQGWAGLDLPIAGITIKEPGHHFIQGLLTAGAGFLALILLFIRPKIAIAPAILAAATALWLYLSPPIIEGQTYEPQKMIFVAVAGAVVLALAGLIAPKKA